MAPTSARAARKCSALFRFDKVQHVRLDFGQDWFNGLDTGGGNWRAIYRNVERASVRESESVFVPFRPDVEVAVSAIVEDP